MLSDCIKGSYILRKKKEYIKFILNSEWNVKEGIGDKYTKKKLY